MKTTGGEVIESTTSNTYVGHAKITNRSSAVLENLEVQIQMHYKAVDGKAQTDEQKTTTKTISLRRPQHLLGSVKSAANARDMPYQSLIIPRLPPGLPPRARRSR